MSKQDKREAPPIPEALPAHIVDAHTHLDACGARDAADVSAMLDRAVSAGVGRVITVADDMAAARWATAATTWDSRVFAAVALHPTRTSEFTVDQQDELARLAEHPRVVAVGETGLDYYWDYAPHRAQQDAFRWHIELAKRLGKPLMIHDREAHDDILAILDQEGPPETVVFHCFSGGVEMARRCVAAGYVLSFAGTVTFRNARELRAAAELVPEEQLLVETDAPFLTPHPFRGRPNEPYCAAYTLRELAELRGQSVIDLANAVTATAERTFRLRSVMESAEKSPLTRVSIDHPRE
ncbi:TatD DNase family protein [Tamaricihabitans halophyticus]|uniref:TatD DNase family protein n=1 Tax=Tamaricihabitans halophyticus TaxID=1262583 RepID=A0A4R2R138_9PSEU|nr:TatD family hydrolase [Tamaricihabitans halophyticus]TCP56382.1 TatD DNase family protein [Tamaricihabitans halophyticus]